MTAPSNPPISQEYCESDYETYASEIFNSMTNSPILGAHALARNIAKDALMRKTCLDLGYMRCTEDETLVYRSFDLYLYLYAKWAKACEQYYEFSDIRDEFIKSVRGLV